MALGADTELSFKYVCDHYIKSKMIVYVTLHKMNGKYFAIAARSLKDIVKVTGITLGLVKEVFWVTNNKFEIENAFKKPEQLVHTLVQYETLYNLSVIGSKNKV